MTKKRVYIEVEERNPFGEDVDERVFTDPTFTSNYVPGYSEERYKNEVRKSENEPIVPLKHRFHWARCRSLRDTEAPEGRRVQHWKQEKYEVANYDDMVKEGYDLSENEAIHKGADGRAYWGEHVLMVAKADVAAAIFQRNEQAIGAQERVAANMMDEATEKFNRTPVAKRTNMKAGAFEMVEESTD